MSLNLNTQLLKKILLNKTFIQELLYLNVTDSTNNYAKKLKDRDNVLIITDFQKSGKGRRENIWISEKAKNLTFTVIKKIPIEKHQLQYVNYFFTLCVTEFVKKFLIQNNTFNTVLIKWPNDILVNNKKICGILIEHNFNTNTFYIGIGININQTSFPDFEFIKASSLRNIIRKEIDRNHFLTGLIIHINNKIKLLYQKHFDLIFTKWKKCAVPINTQLIINNNFNISSKGVLKEYLKDGSINVEINGKNQIFIDSASNIIPKFLF